MAVIAWDVGHNPYGRAYLLAETLSRAYEVSLVGFQFPRFGDAVWPPLRDAPIQPVVIPGCDFPGFQHSLARVVPRIDADVIIACKARLPALQLGLMLKAARNRPLLVDVDDYELSFFENRAPLEDLTSISPESLAVPFEEAWTRYAENLVRYADAVIVSNPALAAKFGGIEVPHARDETRFDPARFKRATARRRLGLHHWHRIVLFVGTPRPHKGLREVLAALKACRTRNGRLVVVGTPPDDWFASELQRSGGKYLRMLPDQPFHALPELLAAADLVCLLQDPENEISKYQLPAKVVDAAAMGIPILASRTPPLAALIDAGVVEPVDADNLADRMAHWLGSSRRRMARPAASRRWFLEHASYAAILPTLFELIEQHRAAPRPIEPGALAFLHEQDRRYGPA
ncbi:MAG: glycosyltransferase family 4 protein [Gammaproteobacteria bacterium]|nr:glycosyltransferase family 4 protein [Gammaproteobacteria bacterium]